MGKPKVLELTEAQRLELERRFRLGEKHCFRMRCRAVLLKAEGLSAAKAGAQTDISFVYFSFRVRKNTFVVLYNAIVHRNKWIKELSPIWENRGLFLFFLPPYSSHLNFAETLWRILKGKWIRPQDYTSTDMLFYATNRALADIGNGLRINYAKHAA